MNAALKIEKLEFFYNPGQPVLSIDSLKIEHGEKVFLYSPSGSGKTTLLGLMAGIHKPVQGAVEVLGRNTTEMKDSLVDRLRGTHMGYIFQQLNLLPYLTLYQNIELPCKLHSERKNRALQSGPVQKVITDLARHLEIDHRLSNLPSEVSTGEMQRAAAARALIGQPEIILADEPTSALDADRTNIFVRLLIENCEKSALVFVSHDRSLEQHFDRSINLMSVNKAAGENVASSSPGNTDREQI